MSDDTIHVPELLAGLFDIPQHEAHRLLATDAVKVKRGDQEVVLKDIDVNKDKLAGQVIAIGRQEAQVPE